MQYYLAPLEGITGYIFRNAFHKYFGGEDACFAPFVSPTMNSGIVPREKRDVLPENNRGVRLIPQILANDAAYFVRAAEELADLGYACVNLNLGCPSKTVVGKKKGSGMLSDLDFLDRFLEGIFDRSPLPISIKTRIGKLSAEDFPGIMDVYNRYPATELIIHPRLQKDFYNNTPDLEAFAVGLKKSRCPVCYNGDILSGEDERKLLARFPEISSVMAGRGILRNPGLFLELRGGKRLEKKQLYAFTEQLCRDYSKVMSGEIPVLFKMKELWCFLHTIFTDSERYAKKIKKAKNLKQYLQAKEQLFAEQEIMERQNIF